MNGKFKLMLVDDEPWALIGLEEIIDWEAVGFEVVARCDCGSAALAEAEKLLPDAVVTDIRMPDMSGIELYHRLVDIRPGIVGAVVSAYADFDIAREAIRSSVLYYALKPLKESEITEMAVMLKQKLENRNFAAAETSTRECDLDNPAFFEQICSGKKGYLLLAKDEAKLDAACINILKLSGKVRTDGYVGMIVGQMPEKIPEELGISRLITHCSDKSEVFNEAIASLEGGFHFPLSVSTRKTSMVGDIELYLYEHLAEDISLKKLAGKFFLSETYLCDIFKKEVGDSIFNFLKRLRLHRAKCLAADFNGAGQDLTFKEIAEQCGYQDYSYFGQLFKKETGMTPENWRKAAREKLK